MKNQDIVGHHIGFAEILITVERIQLYGCNFNCFYLDISNDLFALSFAILQFCVRNQILFTLHYITKLKHFIKFRKVEHPQWQWPTSWIYQNVNNFYTGEADSRPYSVNPSLRSEMNAFVKIQETVGRNILDLLKC